jgi:hypothetical protein
LSKYGELIFDVLRYATRLLNEGDESALLAMGFSPDQIRAIEGLTLKSLQRIGQLGGHFLDFRIDPASFERVMRRIEQEKEDQTLQDEMLRAGAPVRMMHHYWGLTSRDCAERRRVLGVDAPLGRPSHADEPALERLWHTWQETDDVADERRRYLVLAQRSDLPLSVIWTAVEEWKGLGHSPEKLQDSTQPLSSPTRNERSSSKRRVIELHR